MAEKQKTSSIRPSSTAKTRSLPPLQILWQDAWELFKTTIGSYAKLLGVLFLVIFLGLLVSILFSLPVTISSGSGLFPVFHHPTPFRVTVWLVLIIWLLLYGATLFIFLFLFPLVSILILQNGKLSSIGTMFHRAKPLLLAYIGTSLLTGVVLAGGGFLLLIPGLIFAVFFIFVPYVVVLEHLSGVTALRKSYALVKPYFWEILLRVVLVEAAIIIGNNILQQLAKSSGIIWLFSLVFYFGSGWFAQSYLYTLYRQMTAKKSAPQAFSMRWIWILSIIGGIVGLIFLSLVLFGLSHLFMPGPVTPQNALPTV